MVGYHDVIIFQLFKRDLTRCSRKIKSICCEISAYIPRGGRLAVCLCMRGNEGGSMFAEGGFGKFGRGLRAVACEFP